MAPASKMAAPIPAVPPNPLPSRLKWAFALGALLAVLPGLIIGRSPLYPGHFLPIFLSVEVLWLLVFVWTVVLKGCNAQGHLHPLAAQAMVFFAFIAGYGLAFLSLSTLGGRALLRAEAGIAKAGYISQIPSPIPPIPDDQNAAYYLQKAGEAPSAQSLFGDASQTSKAFYEGKSQRDTLFRVENDLDEGRWSAEDRAMALRLLSAHQDSIRSVAQAFQTHGLNWGTDPVSLPPHFYALFTWSSLYLLKARLLADQNNARAAMQSLQTALFLGNAARQAKFLGAQMLAAGMDRHILEEAPPILSKMSPDLIAKDLFPLLAPDELEKSYRTSLQIQYLGLHDSWVDTSLFFYVPYLAFDRAAYDREQVQRLGILDLPYSQQPQAFGQLGRQIEKDRWFCDTTQIDGDLDAESGVLQAIALDRLIVLATDARLYDRQHHAWPKALRDIPTSRPDQYQDPFNDNADFQLKAEGKGLQIVSVGPQTLDEKGNVIGRTPIVWSVGP